MDTNLRFRSAAEDDTGLILRFIKALAEFEHLSDKVSADEALLREWLFDKKIAEVIFAVADGKEVGFALFFHSFSTFLGKAGIYLEDLYVIPEFRDLGYGKALMKKLARIAAERGCGRFEWQCLDWNRAGIDFYLSLGAEPLTDWTLYRVSGKSLLDLAYEDT